MGNRSRSAPNTAINSFVGSPVVHQKRRRPMRGPDAMRCSRPLRAMRGPRNVRGATRLTYGERRMLAELAEYAGCSMSDILRMAIYEQYRKRILGR
jgi:hypothetical protein